MSAIDRIQHELDLQGIKPSKMMNVTPYTGV